VKLGIAKLEYVMLTTSDANMEFTVMSQHCCACDHQAPVTADAANMYGAVHAIQPAIINRTQVLAKVSPHHKQRVCRASRPSA
jgi:hypothetical protein